MFPEVFFKHYFIFKFFEYEIHIKCTITSMYQNFVRYQDIVVIYVQFCFLVSV